MALPVPDLDDRRFQDLVDDAKRLVQQRCPEWTDHNVSDPGVTLIETFAFMVDQLLYRLNRVPDRLYVTFLDLIGVRLLPPAAARTRVTFWLSAPQPERLVVAGGTEVASVRTEAEEPVVFATTADLVVVPCELSHLATAAAEQGAVDRTDELLSDRPVRCFSDQPRYDDALLVGLSDAVPSDVLVVRLDCAVEGVGVDPRQPPLVWEAWDGSGWAGCELERDETGGLNRPGDVVLHVPPTHSVGVVARRRAGWVRCRVVPAAEGQPFYTGSPVVRTAAAFTIGGTVEAVHAETVTDDLLGLSEGVPGQRFTVSRPPVVAGDEPFLVEVAGGDGWQEWEPVDSFAGSRPADRHVHLDPASGEVSFGPAVREPDGALRQYGAVPPKGVPVRVPTYRTGGGQRGNVARGALTVLRSSLPFVARVENRRRAAGGVDGETLEAAKLRGPLALRTRDRAVTGEDYEQLARQAAPGVARVRCVTAGGGGGRGRGARARRPPPPWTTVTDGCASRTSCPRRTCSNGSPSTSTPGASSAPGSAWNRPTTRASRWSPSSPPAPARSPSGCGQLPSRRCTGTSTRSPGGPEAAGWPFGRPVQSGEVFAVLQRLAGVEMVEEVRLFGADPLTGRRGEPVQRIDLGRHALVFSFEHQVRVAAGA